MAPSKPLVGGVSFEAGPYAAENGRHQAAREELEGQKDAICDEYNKPRKTRKTPEESRAFAAAVEAVNDALREEDRRHQENKSAIAHGRKPPHSTAPSPSSPYPSAKSKSILGQLHLSIRFGPGPVVWFGVNGEERAMRLGEVSGWKVVSTGGFGSFGGEITIPIPETPITLGGGVAHGQFDVQVHGEKDKPPPFGEEDKPRPGHDVFRMTYDGVSVSADALGLIKAVAALRKLPNVPSPGNCSLTVSNADFPTFSPFRIHRMPSSPGSEGEAGPPTGFQGLCSFLNVGGGVYGSFSGSALLLGCTQPALMWLPRCFNVIPELPIGKFKYLTMFASGSMGLGASLGSQIVDAFVHPPQRLARK